MVFKKINQNDHYNDLRMKNIILEEGFFHSYDFEGLSVDFYGYIKDYKNDSSNLAQIAKSKTTLVLLIYAESCNKCEDENINAVKKFKKNYKSNVFIGIAGLNDRRFKAFVTNHEIQDIAYHIPDGYFEGFKFNPIVYFLVTDQLETRCFYAPSDIFPGLTQSYFLKIKRLYNF